MSSQLEYSIKSLLEAGAHFGHQAIHWNPKMSRYVFMKRRGIHIIDLQKTVLYLERACNQLKNITAQGGKILFVGTKKQIKEIVKLKVEAIDQFYITQRWIGGLLTNYPVVSKSIQRLQEYTDILENQEKQKEYTKNQLGKIKKERNKLHEIYCGVVGMEQLPDAVFIVDVFYEKNAALEAKVLGIPVFAVVDTNGDPDYVDVIIPGNDDAIRSVGLFLDYAVEAIKEGNQINKRKQVEEDLFAEQIKKEEEKKSDQVEKTEKTEKMQTPEEKNIPVKEIKVTEVDEKVRETEGDNQTDQTPEANSSQQSLDKDKTISTPDLGEEKNKTTVSAREVKELRDLTNVSMMECKKALVQSGGNKEAAIKILKERGMAVAAKRAGKDTNEGVVLVKNEAKQAWMANICCETDFVAKGEHFQELLKAVKENFVKQGLPYFESEDFQKIVTEVTAKTGEKLAVTETVYSQTENGRFFSYLHANHKVGVILGLQSENPEVLNTPEVEELGKDLCLQVAAMNPVAISMDKISAEVIEEQKQIFLKKMANDEKPAEIKEKIIQGQIKKHFSELCLLDMEFVKENGKSVKTLITEISQKVNAPLEVFEFKRNHIGN